MDQRCHLANNKSSKFTMLFLSMLTQLDLNLASMPKCQPMKCCEYGHRSQTGLVGRPKTFEFKVCLFEEEEKKIFQER